MTPHRHGSSIIEFPNDLEIVHTRLFDAPIQLVFDVFTQEEHVRKTFAPVSRYAGSPRTQSSGGGTSYITISGS